MKNLKNFLVGLAKILTVMAIQATLWVLFVSMMWEWVS